VPTFPSELAVTPVALTCACCRGEMALSPNPGVQQAEVVAFCAAHNGHGERLSYQVRILA
jgi:hypothetical protein